MAFCVFFEKNIIILLKVVNNYFVFCIKINRIHYNLYYILIMWKKLILLSLVLISGIMLAWCEEKYQLLVNPIEFNTERFVNPNNEDDDYLVIEYNWRTYAPYGTSQWFMKKNDVGDCIWYIVQDWVKIEDTLLCLLVSDIENNYLAEIDTVWFMSQPIFFRAIDTKWENIFTPRFIDSLEYELWK